MSIPNEKERYTYADYLHWNKEGRYEGTDGIVFMTPSPTPQHQRIVTALSALFFHHLQDYPCEVFVAPIDVCLFATKDTPLHDIKDWYIPDLVIVCEQNKIGSERIYGAPDFVVEILSPSTAKHDRITKFRSYEKAGVKEYWIVDPIHTTVEVYVLQNDRFQQMGMYYKDNSISVHTFPECIIELEKVFP
ncbi:Uma2 family endonuclease [Bacillus alveayuensis]|jgi:Uma2 family endonuclease|uniref:Uma2 family endonuclease n=1 Tax=Aeribacillus alveayuensis TaxID=279215 RepID=UPI0005D10FA4|nr:Uma2 family endonuclease [Bacillus alveayuensis]